MTNSIQVNESSVFAGLGTATFTVVTAGLYTVAFTTTIPSVEAGGPGDSTTTAGGSALSVVINQDTGGGPVAKLTVASPSPYQRSTGGKVVLQCAAADVITVVLSSSAAVDKAANAVKTIINLYQGE